MSKKARSSVVADLLLAAPPQEDPCLLSGEIAVCIEDLGFRVTETRVAPEDHLLVNCDRVQVLVACCPVPFGPDEFAGAGRPGENRMADRLALEALRRHRASLKILVTAPPDAEDPASEAERRLLCWEIADLVTELVGAVLVYWHDTDTLFTAGEFARAELPRQVVPAVLAGPEAAPPPGPEPALAHPGAHVFALSPDEELEEIEAERLRPATAADWERISRGLPPEEDDQALLDEELQRQGTNWGLLLLLMVLSFPVAISVVIYQIFRGPNAHLAAKALCVTSLGVALNEAGMIAEVMTLL